MIAFDHQSAIKYVDLAIHGETIRAKVTVAPSDISDAPEPRAQFVRDWIVIEGCTPGQASQAPDLDGRFIAVTWEVQCSAAPRELDLDLGAFFALDPRQEAIVRVGDLDPVVIRADAPRWAIPVGNSDSGPRWWLVIPAVLVVLGLGAVLMRRLRP